MCGSSRFSLTLPIRAYDDAGYRYPPKKIELPKAKLRDGRMDGVFVINFNSDDLEYGNPNKHFPYGVGAGEGDWWLRITSDEETIVQAFIRTSDGFLTAMRDALPRVINGPEKNAYRELTSNPGYNTNQVSSLRIVNTSNRRLHAQTVGAIDRNSVVNTPLHYDIYLKPY